MDAGQASREMEKILRALVQTERMLAGHDQAAAATALVDRPRYSPLRTLVGQAATSAEQVLQFLRTNHP